MIKDFDLEKAAAEYQGNKPFPHIILRNMIPDEILDKVVAEFPDIAAIKNANKINGVLEGKNYTSGRAEFGPTTNALTDYFNSQEWLDKLQYITGIEEKLVGDVELVGGGLSESHRGHRLTVHTDFNTHMKNGLDRRVNLLVYLNKGWQEEWNGAIELWNEDMTECQSKAYPHFNTIVIFSTNEISNHGFPDPLQCPEGVKRMSLNMYYFSDGRPEHEKTGRHMSLWKKRKGNPVDDVVDSAN